MYPANPFSGGTIIFHFPPFHIVQFFIKSGSTLMPSALAQYAFKDKSKAHCVLRLNALRLQRRGQLEYKLN
jgi:hypothetical protein